MEHSKQQISLDAGDEYQYHTIHVMKKIIIKSSLIFFN